eukprot:6178693-Pleurochrysis_carterae.AAC.3
MAYARSDANVHSLYLGRIVWLTYLSSFAAVLRQQLARPTVCTQAAHGAQKRSNLPKEGIFNPACSRRIRVTFRLSYCLIHVASTRLRERHRHTSGKPRLNRKEASSLRCRVHAITLASLFYPASDPLMCMLNPGQNQSSVIVKKPQEVPSDNVVFSACTCDHYRALRAELRNVDSAATALHILIQLTA